MKGFGGVGGRAACVDEGECDEEREEPPELEPGFPEEGPASSSMLRKSSKVGCWKVNALSTCMLTATMKGAVCVVVGRCGLRQGEEVRGVVQGRLCVSCAELLRQSSPHCVSTFPRSA